MNQKKNGIFIKHGPCDSERRWGGKHLLTMMDVELVPTLK
jgi:hypothetical protein